MLRNSYYEKYKSEKRKKSEYEKVILKNDGEHILALERPLSTIYIRKLPKNDLPIFVNDLMCNKESGHLIYPLTFSHQVHLYLKQQNYAYRITTFNKDKDFIDMMKKLKKKREQESIEIQKKTSLSSPKLSNLKKREEIEDMKVNLNSFKNDKLNLINKLKRKTRKFYKTQPLIDRKLTKLKYQTVNDIRIRGYEKAFQFCNNKSLSNKNFNLPDITVNESNVYSRLYNNIIVKKHSRNINQSGYNGSKYRIEKNHINHIHSNSMNYFDIKNQSSSIPQSNGEIGIKNQEFHVSNINKNLDGKEFTKKVTQKMFKRCLNSFSGGPKINLKKSFFKFNLNSNYYKNKRAQIQTKVIKRFVNYHAKLTSKNCFLKMKNDSSIKKNNSFTMRPEKINELILANSNSKIDLINIKKYRDTNYNTNLHRSVLKNNIKFVEYFIKKGLNINKKNKNGNTALHLAFKIRNYDIIKLLLENGASIKIKNNKGITPFDIADKDMKITFNLVEKYNNSQEY